jgi:NAD(P)-dependent dehydrogenase (short-subunit alcohol dehydrogenase family)
VSSRALLREQIPEDPTATLEYLLSAASDFMTGQTVVVDGASVMR